MAGQADTGTGVALVRRTGILTEIHRLDFALLVVVGLLAALSLAVVWIQVEVSAGGLDLVLNTVTAIAAAGAAALAWVRYRAESQISGAYESSAFLMLFATRAVLVLLAILGLQAPLGLTTADPQQWPIYGWTLARLGTALLLVRAASIDLHPEQRRTAGTGAAVMLLPLAAILGLLALLPFLEPFLPVVTRTVSDGQAAVFSGASMVAPATVVQAVVAGVYLWGASLYRQLFRLRGRRYAAYLSVALVIAAFSQVHWAIKPGIYTSVVTTDDLLRAAMSFVLLIGLYEQSREDVGRLRQANVELEEHRTIEAERAGREAAIARELHDGIAQELWLAKLKLSGVEQAPDLGPDAGARARETGVVIDRALEQARTAVSSMRNRSPVKALGETLAETVEDFADHSGIRAELSGTVPEVSPRVAAEVDRIVREALTNALKHADATVVRVSVRSEGPLLEVTVADNGRGFGASQASGTGYGIRGMHERAALVGGEVEIQSKPQDGTRVVLRISGEGA